MDFWKKLWKDMWEATRIQLKNEIHPKRITVLVVLVSFAGCVLMAAVYISKYESPVYRPSEKIVSEEIRSEKQNLGEIYKDSFADLSRRDKELAFLYMRKRFLAYGVPYNIYTIQRGENYWTAAKKYNVNIDTIVGSNPEMESLNAYVGKELIVLSRFGVIHEVLKNGETIENIAQTYSVDPAKIKQENKMPWLGLRRGDLLFIPGAKPVFMSEGLRAIYDKRKMFRSPISGAYTSVFGTRTHPVTEQKKFHTAVDIRAKIGTWVGATADGTVVDCGWSDSLGNYIKISHKGGYMSLYGHLSKYYVRTGQKVKANALIAKTGNTGRTTGPHLHFGIFKDGKAINPMQFIW